MTHFSYIESKMNKNHPKLDGCGHPFWKIIVQHNIHPKLDCTCHPFLEGYFSVRFIQNWIVLAFYFRKNIFECS